MRRLSAGRTRISRGIHSHANEVATVARIGQRIRQNAESGGRIDICRALPTPQRWTDQQQEGDDRRHWIAWETEEQFLTPLTEGEWFARLYGDLPEVHRAADFFEGLLHEVQFPDG